MHFSCLAKESIFKTQYKLKKCVFVYSKSFLIGFKNFTIISNGNSYYKIYGFNSSGISGRFLKALFQPAFLGFKTTKTVQKMHLK